MSKTNYCKTPLISTYVFSGLATEQVLIFGAVLIFGGYYKAEAKILQGRSLFNPVLSAHKTQLCMFQRLCTYFQDTGVLIFGGYVLSGHCNQQQISVKTEGVLIFGGVLIYGVLRYGKSVSGLFHFVRDSSATRAATSVKRSTLIYDFVRFQTKWALTPFRPILNRLRLETNYEL